VCTIDQTMFEHACAVYYYESFPLLIVKSSSIHYWSNQILIEEVAEQIALGLTNELLPPIHNKCWSYKITDTYMDRREYLIL
jgi:hypothetical protein